MPDTIRNLAGDFLDDKKKQISDEQQMRYCASQATRAYEQSNSWSEDITPRKKTQNDHRDKSCISSFLFFSCYFALNGSFCYGLGERGYFSFLQAYGFSSYETGITVVTSSPF